MWCLSHGRRQHTLNLSISLYWWILNILSICTTKHNLNFDTFYSMKYPYWTPQTLISFESWDFQLSNSIGVWGLQTESFKWNKHRRKMVEVVTLRSLMVQIIFSPFLWLGNPVTIPTNFSMWAENGQNCYLPWRVATCFVFFLWRDVISCT